MPTAKKTRLHAILGSDSGEVARAARELAARLAPADAGDFGVDTIDGAAENADAAVVRIHQTIDALNTMPFFGGAKLVWLKNANFLGDTVTGRAESVQDAVAALLAVLKEGLPGETVFLLSATEVDKRRTFYKSLAKLADVQVFDKIDTSRGNWEESAAALAMHRAREAGFEFEPAALELFVMLAGAEGRQIANEVEKIALHLGKEKRRITKSEVELLVPQTHAAVIWELGNAILARDARIGLELVNQLLRNGESAIGILLVAIIPSVRNLLLVRDLMIRHKLKAPDKPFFFGKILERLGEVALAHLPRKKDGTLNSYPLGLAASGAHRYELAELIEAHEACLTANIQLVSSQLSPGLVLERLLLQILQRK